MNIFLSYDLQRVKGPAQPDNKAKKQADYQVERFFNKEQNFSISWYQDVRSLYNHSIEKQVDAIQAYKNELARIEKQPKKGKKKKKGESPFKSRKRIELPTKSKDENNSKEREDPPPIKSMPKALKAWSTCGKSSRKRRP